MAETVSILYAAWKRFHFFHLLVDHEGQFETGVITFSQHRYFGFHSNVMGLAFLPDAPI